MKNLSVLIIFLSVLTTHFSFSQDYFVVMSTNAGNGITFQQGAEDPIRVFPGMQLGKTGILLIEAGKSLSLVYAGQKLDCNGPRQIALTNLVNNIQQQEESSFMSRFWNFVSTSVSKTENPREMDEYHEKYMTNTVAGIKGFGDKAFDISVPVHFTETLSGEFLDLHWECSTTDSIFSVTIMSDDEQVEVMKMLTHGKRVKLPLSALALEADQVYSLKIATTDDAKLASPGIRFSYEPELVSAFISELSQQKEYRALLPEEQVLYLCWELEKERYFNAAYEQYHGLLSTAPDNPLYQKVFAAFLVRMNDLPAAKVIISQ
jgi:hypothetical protein